MKKTIRTILILIVVALVITIIPRLFHSDERQSAEMIRREAERTSGIVNQYETKSEKKFKASIASGDYHFFIFHSPLSLPLGIIGQHTRIVTVDHDKIDRRDIFMQSGVGLTGRYRNHLHVNYYAPREGLEVLFRQDRRHRNSKIDYHISGNEKSLAAEVVKFVETNIRSYPQKDTYKGLGGPNSNSLPQWVLDNFPEISYTMPRRAIGKNFHSKK